MLREMPAEIFREWQAFDLLEPVSTGVQVARLQATLANLYRDRKRAPDPFTWADFAEYLPTEAQSSEDLWTQFTAWAKFYNPN